MWINAPSLSVSKVFCRLICISRMNCAFRCSWAFTLRDVTMGKFSFAVVLDMPDNTESWWNKFLRKKIPHIEAIEKPISRNFFFFGSAMILLKDWSEFHFLFLHSKRRHGSFNTSLILFIWLLLCGLIWFEIISKSIPVPHKNPVNICRSLVLSLLILIRASSSSGTKSNLTPLASS